MNIDQPTSTDDTDKKPRIEPEGVGIILLLPLILVLLALSTGAFAEPTNDELRREWLNIQVDSNRKAQKTWWEALDHEAMRAFIRAGVLLDVEDRHGWTPLHSAARFNSDSRILVALLDGGADVDAKDRAGDTPLHWAAAENANLQVVRELLSAGADVNARDRYGWLPLHTAVESNSNPAVVLQLLDAGSHRSKRAYFILFGPKFLLNHNPNLSREDKTMLRFALEGRQPEPVADSGSIGASSIN